MKVSTKIISILVSFTLVLCAGLGVFAEEKSYTLESIEANVIIPEDAYFFTPTTPENDENWEKSGLNVLDQLNFMNEYSSQALVSFDGGETVIYIQKNETDDTKSYFNLQGLSETELSDFVGIFNFTDEEQGASSEAVLYMKDDIPFVEINLTALDADGNTLYEHRYSTILNGYSISTAQLSINPITDEAKQYSKDIVDNIEFTNIIPPDVFTEEEAIKGWISVGLLGLVIISLIVFIIYRVTTTRREKKELATLADKLAIYRKERLQNENKNRESLFDNTTEFTDFAVRHYSKFQCYKNKILAPVLTIILWLTLCGLMIYLGSEWWMSLIVLGCIGYTIYKIIISASTLERSLRKSYAKMPSRVARYIFFEDEFCITGIESGEFHPYFQITSLRENGNYLYFYFGDNNCYYIQKDKFAKGSMEEFKSFISKKSGRRF